MRLYEIALGEDIIQLRLTTAKLEAYLKNTDSDQNNPLIGVLDAMTLLPKRVKLLTAALQWPGNQNKIKDGADLLDKLLDDGKKPSQISDMILELAAMAGLMEDDDLASMIEANRQGNGKFRKALLDMMAGKEPAGAADPAAPDPQAEENPTTAPTA